MPFCVIAGCRAPRGARELKHDLVMRALDGYLVVLREGHVN